MKSIEKYWELIKDNFEVIFAILTILLNLGMTIYFIVFTYALWTVDTSGFESPISSIVIFGVQIFITIAFIIITFYLWSKKDDQSKLYRNLFLAITFILIFSIPFTLSLLHMGRTLSQIDGFQIGTADGWLGFIGSLLGGVITMLAVLFTIHHEKILNSTKSIPKFTFYLKNEKLKIIGKVLSETEMAIDTNVTFELSNNSSHNAKEFEITDFQTGCNVEELKKRNTKEVIKDLNIMNNFENTFDSNEKRMFPIHIKNSFKFVDHFFIRIDYTFYDYLKFKKHKHSSVAMVNISVDDLNSKKIINLIDKTVKCNVELSSSKYRSLNL